MGNIGHMQDCRHNKEQDTKTDNTFQHSHFPRRNLARTHIDDDANHSNLFLGGNNTLYWPTDGNDSNAKILGFRAYFHINTSSPSPAPIYRGMPASLRIKSTPTDIETVQTDNAPRKELRNGQLVIIRNGETFSLNGQKL